MARPRYDVFISYRRESAAELAQLIRNALTVGWSSVDF